MAAGSGPRDSGEGHRKQTTISDKSRTKQAFKDETDINRIVKRHVEGYPPPLETRQPMYGDFSQHTSLLQATQAVEAAEEEFMTLPAAVRQAARNDPVEFLNMMASEDGAQKLVDAGLPVEGVEPTPDSFVPSTPDEPAKAAPEAPPAAAAAETS